MGKLAHPDFMLRGQELNLACEIMQTFLPLLRVSDYIITRQLPGLRV